MFRKMKRCKLLWLTVKYVILYSNAYKIKIKREDYITSRLYISDCDVNLNPCFAIAVLF